MFQALSRPATSSSDRVNNALAPAPPLSARAASATAFRYCGTANLALSPRPTTSTRGAATPGRSEEHTSELQSLMRISYAVFCLKKKTETHTSDTYQRLDRHYVDVRHHTNQT